MPGAPLKIRKISNKLSFHKYNWRRHVIAANTNGVGEGEALQKIHNVLPIPQDITY
jgi:hypothetical protein